MIRILGFLAAVVVATLFGGTPGKVNTADAAVCFWVGASADPSSAANWSSASGGAGSTCAAGGGVPDTDDDVCFDAGDATNATISSTLSWGSADFSGSGGCGSAGPYIGTFTINTSQTLNITCGGAACILKFDNAMTFAGQT
jgi:hypothetical protein